MCEIELKLEQSSAEGCDGSGKKRETVLQHVAFNLLLNTIQAESDGLISTMHLTYQ